MPGKRSDTTSKKKKRGRSPPSAEIPRKSGQPSPEHSGLHRDDASPEKRSLHQTPVASSHSLDKKFSGKTDIAELDKAKRKKRKGKTHTVEAKKEVPDLPETMLAQPEVLKTLEAVSPRLSENEDARRTFLPPEEYALVRGSSPEEPGAEPMEDNKEQQRSSALSTGVCLRGMPGQADLAVVSPDSHSTSVCVESCRRDQGEREVSTLTAEGSCQRGLSGQADMGHVFAESPWSSVPDETYRQDNRGEQKASALTTEASSQRGLSTEGDMGHIFAESPWSAVADGSCKPDDEGQQKASTSATEGSSQRGLSTGADMGHIFAESPFAIVPDDEQPKASAPTTGLSSERGLSTGGDMRHVFKKCPWIVDLEERSRRFAASQSRSAQRDSDQNSSHGPVLLKGMDDLQINKPLRVRVVRFLSLVAVILIVFAVIFVAIYYKSGGALPMSLQKFCTEDECHRATSYLTSTINRSIDACVDFYQRVCYRWISGKEGVSFVNGVVLSYYESVAHEVLTSNMTEIGHIGSHVFGAVFMSCFRFVRSEHTVAELIAQVKERLKDSLPSSRSSWKDAMALVVKLTLKHGVATVLGIGWEKVGTNQYLHLSAQGPLRYRLGATVDADDRYEDYVTDAMGYIVSNITDSILRRVLALDAAVTDATLKGSAVEEVHSSINITGGLSMGLNADFWTRTINTYMPQKKITSADSVLTSGFDIIKRVLSNLKAAPPSVAYGYLNLLVAGEVLRYDYLQKQSSKPNDLTTLCLQATQKVLTQTWPHIISVISRHHYKVHYLQALFKQTQEAVEEQLRLSKWMDAAARLAVKHRLARSTLHSFSEAKLPDTADYRGLNIDGRDFVADYLTALAYEAQVILRSTPRVKQTMFLNELQLSGSPYFDFDGDSLVFPLPYTATPIFYLVNGEQFYNFATVGVIMAEVLAKAASSPQYTRQLQSGPHLQSLSSATECYRRQFETTFLKSRLPTDLGNSIFASTVSVRAAYEKLRKYCRNNLSSREFDVYWTRIQQLFFERYCLLSCGDGESGRILSPLQRCVIPLLNMPEFAVAYGCQNGTRMNPVAECEPL